MNTKVLQRCVDALNSDSPDISYIKGMLETLIEMQGVQLTANIKTVINEKPKETNIGLVDEVDQEQADLAGRYAGGPIGRIIS